MTNYSAGSVFKTFTTSQMVGPRDNEPMGRQIPTEKIHQAVTDNYNSRETAKQPLMSKHRQATPWSNGQATVAEQLTKNQNTDARSISIATCRTFIATIHQK